AGHLNVKEFGKIEKSSDALDSRGPLHQTRQDTTPPLPVYPSNSIEDQSIEYDEYRISRYHPHGFSRELSTLAKLYNDCSKYSGNGDSFDYKFDIFLRQCENADIPRNGLKNAFPIMLKEDALYYYYNSLGSEQKFSLESMCKIFKDKFEGVEHKKALLDNWNKFNFETIKNRKENTGKNMIECVRILPRELRTMQHGLDINLRNDAFIHNKIVTACENQSAFKTVCERPSPTLAGLLSDLRSAAAVHDRINNITINESSTLFTDRRYHQGQQRYPFNRENNMKQFQFKSSISGKSGIKPGKRCIVCKKEGCWSTKHSQKEKDEAFENLKLKMKNSVEDRFSQYCLEIEGIPPIIEHGTESQFDMDYNDSQISEFVLDMALLSVASNDDISPIFVT
ncbi:hypothetical protein GcM3_133029, partial [Golovinomyces cichoracearum]